MTKLLNKLSKEKLATIFLKNKTVKNKIKIYKVKSILKVETTHWQVIINQTNLINKN